VARRRRDGDVSDVSQRADPHWSKLGRDILSRILDRRDPDRLSAHQVI
jgi:hypothetical protein